MDEGLTWIACMPYLGSKCPECKRQFDTPDDIRDAKFGIVPDVVCKGCWEAYGQSTILRLLDVTEMVWGRVAERTADGGAVVRLSKSELAKLAKAVRPATNMRRPS
jgi:hypothetical protein